MKKKQLIEVNIPILAQDNTEIGTLSQRFNSRSEVKRRIFMLEGEGLKLRDPFNEEYWSVVEVDDETDLN